MTGESRSKVLAAMWATRSPLTVADIAEQVGLHPNTVRFHLGILADHGMITQKTEDRNSRGRPRIFYSIIPSQLYANRRNYQLLSQMLISYLTELRPRQKELAAVGDAWGKHLARQTHRTADTPLQRVVDSLEQTGFAPRLDGQRIIFHHCPFREAADQNRAVVCPVHLGLMRGMFTETRAQVSVSRLIPAVQPSICVALLTPLV